VGNSLHPDDDSRPADRHYSVWCRCPCPG